MPKKPTEEKTYKLAPGTYVTSDGKGGEHRFTVSDEGSYTTKSPSEQVIIETTFDGNPGPLAPAEPRPEATPDIVDEKGA